MSLKPLTGLFFGAGASYEAGMPLVWELTSEIKNWLTAEKIRELNAGWRVQGGGYSDRVIDDLISMLERPDAHYESVLGYMEVQFRRQRSLSQEYHGLYSWLVELVSHLLYLRHVNNLVSIGRALPYYDGIRALAEANTPLWVFSLNHDVIVEAVAAHLSIPIHSGFSPSVVTLPRLNSIGNKKGEIRAEILTKHDLEHHAMYFPNPFQPGIYLLKIHGALDVFTFNNGEDLLRLLPTGPGYEGVIDALRAANEDLFFSIPGAPGGRAKAVNEICYPDGEGVLQFLRRSLLAGAFKFDARRTQVLPKDMLKHFQQNLNFVSNLVCVGYSFGDLHINTVLREWLEFTPDRRLEIVNPTAQDIPAFLLHLAPQVIVTKSSATDYLDSKANIVRSPLQQLEKRLASVLRSLGKERAEQELTSFKRKNKERISQAFLSKLKEIPTVDGQPDFSDIGEPATVAKQWAAEIALSHEKLLLQLLEHLQANGRG